MFTPCLISRIQKFPWKHFFIYSFFLSSSEYLAPEIIQNRGHNKGVDFWALGILIYEMLVGRPPFYAKDAYAIYELILAGKIEWSKNFDFVAKDLIKKLLVLDR